MWFNAPLPGTKRIVSVGPPLSFNATSVVVPTMLVDAVPAQLVRSLVVSKWLCSVVRLPTTSQSAPSPAELPETNAACRRYAFVAGRRLSAPPAVVAWRSSSSRSAALSAMVVNATSKVPPSDAMAPPRAAVGVGSSSADSPASAVLPDKVVLRRVRFATSALMAPPRATPSTPTPIAWLSENKTRSKVHVPKHSIAPPSAWPSSRSPLPSVEPTSMPPSLATGRTTALLSRVTAPVRASRRPFTEALVVTVIEASAKMLPWNAAPVPMVAELPTCQ